MAFETVVNMEENKEWAKCKYIRYTYPEDGELKDNALLLKKNQHVEGYYLRSYTRLTPHGEKYNHVLVQEDGLHLVIPDNKDITKAFLSDRMQTGAFTRFTYLGKTQFEGTNAEGKKFTAKAAKALIEQDKDRVVVFDGEEGCEVIAGTNLAPNKNNSAITAQEVPF